MLLWEFLTVPIESRAETATTDSASPARMFRLPYDRRCAAVTKTGRRCRGRIFKDREWCMCHDPEFIDKRRRRRADGNAQGRRRMTHLPDGYLRKLSNRRSVGDAMDRLYREVRLGVITPDMGGVMFQILTRLLDSGLANANGAPRAPHRSKAARVRPKLQDVLTRAERAAWRKAVASAPLEALKEAESRSASRPQTDERRSAADQPNTHKARRVRLAMPVAS